jgi:hypothetical protein
MRNRIVASVGLIMLVSIFLIVTPTPTRGAQFVLASWDFPDEYGQGIDALTVFENSTGSWLIIGGFSPNVVYNGGAEFNWSVGLGIKIRAFSFLNSTRVGVYSTDQGKNYLRHNVTVTRINGTTVFSQQNFTYYNAGAVAEMYEYHYDVILNFYPEAGEIYTVTITYEVFY